MAARALSKAPAQIKQHHIASLQSSFISASSRFSSYNFREYFLRRSTEKFHEELPKLLGTKEVNDHFLSIANDATKEKLHRWWDASVEELSTLERASLMNRMFEGPKLVVENVGNLVGKQSEPTPGIDSSSNEAQHPHEGDNGKQ